MTHLNDQTSRLLRAALLAARRLCAKNVTISEAGVVAQLPHGRDCVLAVEGIPIALDAAVVRASGRGGRSWRRRYPDVEHDGVEWDFKDGTDELLTIVPRKPFPPTISALAAFDDESVAMLRSLYARSDISIGAAIEGETRAKDLALAIMAERASIGLPGSTRIVHDSRYHERDAALPLVAPLEAPSGALWSFGLTKNNGYRLRDADLEWTMRIEVDRRPWFQTVSGYEDNGRPHVSIAVGLIDSKPAGRIIFSRTALDLADAESAKAPDLPWSVVEAERERRKAKAPKREKTWLPTTLHVAQAFVDRTLPRGYVGDRPLYFHGPIAYSQSDRNVVAAFVQDTKGDPVLVLGRHSGWDGDAVTTSARGDITSVACSRGLIDNWIETKDAPGKMPLIVFEDISEVLSFAGTVASEVPSRFRKSKDENEHARFATLDENVLSRWYRRKLKEARQEIKDAHASPAAYPTKRRARSFEIVLELDAHIERTNRHFGFSIARIPDLAEVEHDHRLAQSAVERRAEELAARKEDAAPAAPTG